MLPVLQLTPTGSAVTKSAALPRCTRVGYTDSPLDALARFGAIRGGGVARIQALIGFGSFVRAAVEVFGCLAARSAVCRHLGKSRLLSNGRFETLACAALAELRPPLEQGRSDSPARACSVSHARTVSLANLCHATAALLCTRARALIAHATPRSPHPFLHVVTCQRLLVLEYGQEAYYLDEQAAAMTAAVPAAPAGEPAGPSRAHAGRHAVPSVLILAALQVWTRRQPRHPGRPLAQAQLLASPHSP